MESSYRDKQRNKIEKLTETPKGGRGFLGREVIFRIVIAIILTFYYS